ncbi:MAG: hypothetical protein IT581_06075 [Verrucomicrobiales bacterium]|nr:hypothetical protein [Verrucomicrobiales bacterium]
MNGLAALFDLSLPQWSLEKYLSACVRLIRDRTGCEGAGVRVIDDKGCLKYVASVGLSDQFLKGESQVCSKPDVCPWRRVIEGRPQASDIPRLNLLGSYTCRDAVNELVPPKRAGHKIQALPCVVEGYRSLLHTPVFEGNQIVASIQLADHRPDRITAEVVDFLEGAAPIIGNRLHRLRLEASCGLEIRQFLTVFENHTAVMLLVDSQTGAIKDANAAAVDFYGFSRADLRRRTLKDLASTPAGKGKGPGLSACHQLANGQVRTVVMQSSPELDSGTHHQLVVVQDITDSLGPAARDLEDRETPSQRIGQDLHDSLGGSLSGLAMISEALAQKLMQEGSENATIASELVDGINEAVSRTRRIAHGLCPLNLQGNEFLGRLNEFATSIQRRYGVSCKAVRRGFNIDLEGRVAAHLLQIVEESVHNGLRHGKADQIRISIAGNARGLKLQVADNGTGLPEPGRLGDSNGIGLQSMEDRARRIGASFEIKRRRQGGTLVTCTLPLRSTVPKPRLQRSRHR